MIAVSIIFTLFVSFLLPMSVDASSSKYLTAVNKCRATYGLSSLRETKTLHKAADTRANEQTILFSHTRPDGRVWNTVSKKTYGEILAMGAEDIDTAISMWLESPSHADLLLDKDFKTVGIARAGNYWAIEFGY